MAETKTKIRPRSKQIKNSPIVDNKKSNKNLLEMSDCDILG
jgi:hypothetical protein